MHYMYAVFTCTMVNQLELIYTLSSDHLAGIFALIYSYGTDQKTVDLLYMHRYVHAYVRQYRIMIIANLTSYIALQGKDFGS